MNKTLTKAEEQVMQTLWNLDQGFLKDIVDAMPEPKPHSNTIATILKILIEKEFVKYQTLGRNNLYKPAISKSLYGKKSVNQLLTNYFDGSAMNLISQLTSSKEISIEDLELLVEQLKK